MRSPTRRSLLLLALLAACDGDPAADVTLTVTEPPISIELLPGGTIDVAWTLEGGPAEVVVELFPLNEVTGTVLYQDTAPEGDTRFTWDGRDGDGALLPPDVYDLEITAYVDGAIVDTAVRNVSVHGVIVTDPRAGDTRIVRASDGQVDFLYLTVSQRVIALATTLDTHVIDERTIPGELVPFERTVHFAGTDLDGAAIPAGVYPLIVHVTDPDGDLAYQATGGMVDWRPGE